MVYPLHTEGTYTWRGLTHGVDLHTEGIYTRRDIYTEEIYTWGPNMLRDKHTEGIYRYVWRNKNTEGHIHGGDIHIKTHRGDIHTWRNKHSERNTHGGVYTGWSVHTVEFIHGGDIHSRTTKGTYTRRGYRHDGINIRKVWTKSSGES